MPCAIIERPAHPRSGTGQPECAGTRSACARASMCTRCPMPCVSCSSGPTIGDSAASGTPGRRNYESAHSSRSSSLIGSGLWVAALLIMAQTVQQSANFSALHPVHRRRSTSAGLLVLFDPDRRPARATGARLAQARGRLAPRSAHGVDVSDARDRAAAARVLFLGRVPESRHRQLVPRRDPRRSGRRTDAVARRARSAHARICGTHASDRATSCQSSERSGGRARPSCAVDNEASSSRCSARTAASSP